MSDFNWNTFNPDQAIADAPPEISYDPIPAAWYPTVIVGAEWKDTQKGGRMLVFKAEVIGGQHKGRLCWTNLNLVNANTETAGRSSKDLALITKAAGLFRPKSENELTMKPIMAYWAVSPEKNGFPAHNEMKDWKPMGVTPDMFQGHTHDVDTNAPASDGVNGTPRVGTILNPGGIDDRTKKPWEK